MIYLDDGKAVPSTTLNITLLREACVLSVDSINNMTAMGFSDECHIRRENRTEDLCFTSLPIDFDSLAHERKLCDENPFNSRCCVGFRGNITRLINAWNNGSSDFVTLYSHVPHARDREMVEEALKEAGIITAAHCISNAQFILN